MKAGTFDTQDMYMLLIEWFETIEEVVLSDTDKGTLMEVAESLSASKKAALEMGIISEDFDDWLQLNVLEQWSSLMEEDTEMANPVQAFYTFAKGGEQRLYFQMLKSCLLAAEAQLA